MDWAWECALVHEEEQPQRSRRRRADVPEHEEEEEALRRESVVVCGITLFPVACCSAMGGTGIELWEASVVLARELRPTKCDTICELGAGLGLAGLVAERKMTANSVVLTDFDPAVLANLETTVRANESRASVVKMEWGRDFPSLVGEHIIFLAADCVYTPRLGRALAETLRHYYCQENKKTCRVFLSQRRDRPGFEDTFLPLVAPYLLDRKTSSGDFDLVELFYSSVHRSAAL